MENNNNNNLYELFYDVLQQIESIDVEQPYSLFKDIQDVSETMTESAIKIIKA